MDAHAVELLFFGIVAGYIMSSLWGIYKKLNAIYWELKKLNETNVAKKAIGYDR